MVRDNIVIEKAGADQYNVFINRIYTGIARVSGDRLVEFPKYFSAEQKKELLRQIMREQREENPPDISDKIRLLVRAWGCPAKKINEGECADFSNALYEKLKDGRIINTADAAGASDEESGSIEPWHSWIEYGGRHYDAETPNGVKDWLELPVFRRNRKTREYEDLLKIVFRNRNDNPPYFHGSHKEWKVYDLDTAHAQGTGFTSEFDHLGLWLTSDKDRARNYGPLVHEFDITLENPFVIEREYDGVGRSSHQPFAEALYDEALAKKHMTAEDRKAIKDGGKIPWRSHGIKRLLKAWNRGEQMFWDDKKLAEKLVKKKRVFDDAMMRFFRNGPYWKALREKLLDAGHDAILFKDSLIDIPSTDNKPHDVIVYLRPATVRAL